MLKTGNRVLALVVGADAGRSRLPVGARRRWHGGGADAAEDGGADPLVLE